MQIPEQIAGDTVKELRGKWTTFCKQNKMCDDSCINRHQDIAFQFNIFNVNNSRVNKRHIKIYTM